MRRTTRVGLLAVALAAAVFAVAACGGSSGGTTSAGSVSSQPAGTTQPAATGAIKTATIAVAGGKAVGGEQTLKVKKGDHVRITVSVDAPQEVHLHGYDIEKTVQPGTPGVWDFTATFEGIFDMESHLNNPPDTLLKLEVEP